MLSFCGIGAQKCGTTWLFEVLAGHPEVSFPAGKEVHFWNRLRHRGLDYYRSLFDTADRRACGDITPAYGILPRPVIAECHAAFPDLRLIFILRDPVERAWSHARMDAVMAGLDPARLPDSWFLGHFRSAASTARGDYETCLRNWLEFYPREQLLLLWLEDIATAPDGVFRRCCRHLGLHERTPGFSGAARAGDPVALRPTLRRWLDDHYAPQIISLADYLGRPLPPWREGAEE